MDRNFADELYSEIVKIPNEELGPISSGNYEESNSHGINFIYVAS